jgi:uncharacterized protein YecE (DUF72 family)
VETISTWAAGGTDVFAYFNNDFDGHAVADAEWLAGALGVFGGRASFTSDD